ncbi:MAG: hypothetical protein WBB42_09105 [Polyangiales bacterium]
MGQQPMDKPPTKHESSAEAEHAPEELRARLRQLAADYRAAFHRKPTEENLQTGDLLRAIGESEELRRKLHQTRTSWLHEKVGASHGWYRWVWVQGIRTTLEVHHGNPEAVVQDLIRWVPLAMRAKVRCAEDGPGYPTNEAELEEAVARVLEQRDFRPELALWKACDDFDSLKVARAVLRGLGMTKDAVKDLLRRDQWEAWLREHGAP